MKIKEQTAQKLILEATTLNSSLKRLFFFLFATPFFVAGVFIILYMGKINILECQRRLSEEISCVLSRKGLLGEEIINLKKGQLQQAKLGINRSDNSNTYRVNLITKKGITPLTEVYSSGLKGKRNHIDQINRFINNPSNSSLIIIQDERWFAYPFGGVFVLVGAGLMIYSLTFFIQVKCIFDKGKQQLFLTEKNLFNTQYIDYKIWQIKLVELIVHRDSKGRKSYSVDVVFKNNSRLRLDIAGGFSGCQEFVDTLNRFLDLSV